jgi:hypothetical protein
MDNYFIYQFTRNESKDRRGAGGGETQEQDHCGQGLLQKLKLPRQGTGNSRLLTIAEPMASFKTLVENDET